MMKKAKALDVIKRNLWMHGYSVKDVRDLVFGKYDLVVAGKYRVIVFGEEVNLQAVDLKEVDVIARVDGQKKLYCTVDDFKKRTRFEGVNEVATKTHSEVFIGPKSP